MKADNYVLSKSNFETTVTGTFASLLHDTDFVDVTLACPDDRQISAHKVILSSCSSFFKRIFLNNPGKEPLIYLKGISHTDLVSVLQFMYSGQTKVGYLDMVPKIRY